MTWHDFNEKIWVFRTIADVAIKYLLIVVLFLLAFVLFRLERVLTPAPITDIFLDSSANPEVEPTPALKGKSF